MTIRFKARFYWLFGVFFVLCFIVAGCQNNERIVQKPSVGYQVVDETGRVIVFSEKPQKILALTSSLQEVLIDLVPPERIAALFDEAHDERISLILQKARKVPGLIDSRPSPEAVMQMKPDLVIAQDTSGKELVDTLHDMGIKVYMTRVPTRVDTIRQRVVLLAEAVGEKANGTKLLAELDEKLKLLNKTISGIPITERKILIAYSAAGAFGSEAGLFHDICTHAGVINGAALAGLKKSDHLSKEQIVLIDPDFLLFPIYSTQNSAKSSDPDTYRLQVIADPAFQQVKAVRNNAVIIINDRYRYTASQYAVDGAYHIARSVYPEHFQAIEVKVGFGSATTN
jgi:iron complex transport system substrate-binding protein